MAKLKVKAKVPKRNPAAKKTKTTARKSLESKSSVLVGKAVPDFSLTATGGKPVSRSGLKGSNVVIYFYPKDATPGCTLQGQDFTRLHEMFKAAGTEVYGVSRDSLGSHEKFKAKQNYSIDLLSDPEETLCQIFGVIKMKNMYGKKVRGIERSTFVLGKDGKLIKEWRGVKVPGHAEEVLEFVRSL